MTGLKTIRKFDEGANQGQLSRSVRGAHAEALQQDLYVAGDLNHHRIREDFGATGSLKVITDTGLFLVTPGGFRMVGNGINEAADSGSVGITGEPGQRLSTTNETAHTIGLTSTVILQPDTQGPLRFTCLVKHPDILTKSMLVGYAGTIADAVTPRVTGATTVLTLVDDDVAACYWDANMTDVDRWFFPHNKDNEAASIDAAVATEVNSGKDIVVSTLSIVTVEINKAGDAHYVISDANGTVQFTQAAALNPAVAVGALILLAADGDAIEEFDILGAELDYFADNS